MQSIVVFGATGSIGESILDIIASHPDRYEVYALSAFTQIDKLITLAEKFLPKVINLPDESSREIFLKHFRGAAFPEIRLGQVGLCETAKDPQAQTVVCAIVGAAGLESTYAAACAGKRILLANKESLVIAGSLLMKAVEKYGASLLPLDSEHNAIFQCLPTPESRRYLQKVIITASGGPFRNIPLEHLSSVTPEQACAHPNWRMGRKISVDSATMVNKGLEVIEAKWLFDLDLSQIEVLIHPQSIIHSMVQYRDGSLLAQLGHHDMRIPISYSLAYPDRISHKAANFELSKLSELTFYAPDHQRYPCLQLAFDALKEGIAACNVLNAANEIAVQAFLMGKMTFTQIAQTIEQMLSSIDLPALNNIEDVLAFDQEIRSKTMHFLKCTYH